MDHYFLTSTESGHRKCYATAKAAAVELLGDAFRDKSNDACRIVLKRQAPENGWLISELPTVEPPSESGVAAELRSEAAFIASNGY